MGNIKGIPPGDVQRMSAGTGVMHSEFNHAEGQTTHFLQIWIEPNGTGIAPSYEQKTIPAEQKRGTLRLVASPDCYGRFAWAVTALRISRSLAFRRNSLSMPTLTRIFCPADIASSSGSANSNLTLGWTR